MLTNAPWFCDVNHGGSWVRLMENTVLSLQLPLTMNALYGEVSTSRPDGVTGARLAWLLKTKIDGLYERQQVTSWEQSQQGKPRHHQLSGGSRATAGYGATMQPCQLAAKGKEFWRQRNYTSHHPTLAPKEATPKNIKDLSTLLNSKMHMHKRNSGQKQEKSYQLNSPQSSLEWEACTQAYCQTLHLPRALGGHPRQPGPLQRKLTSP